MAAPRTNHVLRRTAGVVENAAVELPPLRPNEVLIKITHSGLCHTDALYHGFGKEMAFGHEGVGVVEEIGSAVTTLEVGQRVGGGYFRESCGKCKYCLTGHETMCLTRDIYADASTDKGTFGDYYIGTETYVYAIPDSISSAEAAPLQCAGATVYNAITSNAVAGDRIGIVGIGGLGHLAIQFAAKLGYEVVVFSTSKAKEDEAKGFGASEFCSLAEPETVKEPIDVLILTGNAYPDFSKFLTPTILARTATIIPLTVHVGTLTAPAVPLFFNGYKIHYSLLADRATHADMLRFAAKHGVRPQVEEFPLGLEGLETALAKLKRGEVRYRAVLTKGE